LLRKAFGLPSKAEVKTFLAAALNKTTSTYYLGFDKEGRVSSTNISSLDPGSPDPRVAEWGGLTGFSGRFGRAIAEAANEAQA